MVSNDLGAWSMNGFTSKSCTFRVLGDHGEGRLDPEVSATPITYSCSHGDRESDILNQRISSKVTKIVCMRINKTETQILADMRDRDATS